MSIMAKLIILRGPSGSGKSTIAKLLHSKLLHKTALIEQDYYRHQMFNNPHTDLEIARHVMCASILAALEQGHDVILEGILSMGKYQTYFDHLFAQHQTENYLFYLDVSFEETVRRHSTRSKREHFGETEMREWYERTSTSGYPSEHIIPESFTAEQSLREITKVTGVLLKSQEEPIRR
jgi:adenylate kinase family enzyme